MASFVSFVGFFRLLIHSEFNLVGIRHNFLSRHTALVAKCFIGRYPGTRHLVTSHKWDSFRQENAFLESTSSSYMFLHVFTCFGRFIHVLICHSGFNFVGIRHIFFSRHTALVAARFIGRCPGTRHLVTSHRWDSFRQEYAFLESTSNSYIFLHVLVGVYTCSYM